MKMKELDPQGGSRPWRPHLDPPMIDAIHVIEYEEIIQQERMRTDRAITSMSSDQ